MKQAKLIKRHAATTQEEVHTPLSDLPVTKHPVETVREWISRRQDHQVSPRQAFAALFAGSIPERTM